MSINRFIVGAGSAFLAATALSACDSMPLQTGKPAKVVEMRAQITPAKEIPPKTGSGQGYAFIWFNEGTRALNWKVYYSGLSGPATAGHFHGPADANANAGVALPLGAAGASPITGQATLTEAQAADLLAGKWYVNIHTQANAGGEIRGQVTPEDTRELWK